MLPPRPGCPLSTATRRGSVLAGGCACSSLTLRWCHPSHLSPQLPPPPTPRQEPPCWATPRPWAKGGLGTSSSRTVGTGALIGVGAVREETQRTWHRGTRLGAWRLWGGLDRPSQGGAGPDSEAGGPSVACRAPVSCTVRPAPTPTRETGLPGPVWGPALASCSPPRACPPCPLWLRPGPGAHRTGGRTAAGGRRTGCRSFCPAGRVRRQRERVSTASSRSLSPARIPQRHWLEGLCSWRVPQGSSGEAGAPLRSGSGGGGQDSTTHLDAGAGCAGLVPGNIHKGHGRVLCGVTLGGGGVGHGQRGCKPGSSASLRSPRVSPLSTLPARAGLGTPRN